MTPRPALGREALYGRFGAPAFGDAVFYACAPALRFELSREGTRTELFSQAYDRAREVLRHVFAGPEPLVLVLRCPHPEGRPPLLPLFRALRECGLRPGPERACWTEGGTPAEGEGPSTVVAFPLPAAWVDRVLWGALAAELGVRPWIPARVYLASPERGVLVHPYDDRGMDVVGPDHALLRELHARFNGYLLDHDRARMDAFFAGAP